MSAYFNKNLILSLGLATMLSVGIISEAMAAKCISDGSSTTGGIIEGTTTACTSCGLYCDWEIKEDGNEKILTISPSVNKETNEPRTSVTMKDFSTERIGTTSNYRALTPWQGQNVTTVIVDDGINNIGDNAFNGENQLIIADISNVTSIGYAAFSEARNLKYVSITPSKITEQHDYAFYLAGIDNGSSENNDTLSLGGCDKWHSYNCSICTKINGTFTTKPNFKMNENATGGNCFANDDCGEGYTASNGLCKKNPTPSTTQQGQDSQFSEQSTVNECVASGKYWQEGKCVSSCGASFQLNDGWCDRQRYTPAEAAQVLTDDNNNSVTITFKK